MIVTLSAASAQDYIYTASSDFDVLRRIDPATNQISDVGALGVNYFFGDLAWAPDTETLYMVPGLDNAIENLYTVDRDTGQATLVGNHGVDNMVGLAYDSVNGVLYANDFSNLYTLDTATGQATLVGPVGLCCLSLTYNERTDQLLAMSSNNAGTGLSVWEVNRQTGALTHLVQYGFNGNAVGIAYVPLLDRYYHVIHTGELYSIDATFADRTLLESGLGDNSGMAFAASPPPQDYLYTASSDFDILRRIDPATNQISDVGPLGVNYFFGDLAYAADTETLFMVPGLDNGVENLYTVDRGSGAASLVGNHGIDNIVGLAYDVLNGVLYANDFSNLYTLDTGTGQATLIGPVGECCLSLTYNESTDQLLGMTSNNAGTGLSVWDVNRQTGALTQLAQYGLNGNAVGFAYAGSLNTYYQVIHTGELFSIDADFTNRTLLESGLGDNSGMAFAPRPPFKDYLYTASSDFDVLRRIDPDTNLITDMGPLGVNYFFGDLAYAPDRGMLFMVPGLDNGVENLYVLNRDTGQAFLVGNHGIDNIVGLAYDDINGVLYANDFSSLYSLDPGTGQATLVAPVAECCLSLTYNEDTDQLLAMSSNNAGTGLSIWDVDRQSGALTQLAQYGLNGNAVGIAYLGTVNRYFHVIHTGELFRIDGNFTNRTLLDSGLGDNSGMASLRLEPIGDSDGDGIFDPLDNCIFVHNPDQRDADGDGFGSLCDADLDMSCIVNAVDLGLFKSVFFTADAAADFNGDGVVNVQDLGIMKLQFFGPPGPSGVTSICGGP